MKDNKKNILQGYTESDDDSFITSDSESEPEVTSSQTESEEDKDEDKDGDSEDEVTEIRPTRSRRSGLRNRKVIDR